MKFLKSAFARQSRRLGLLLIAFGLVALPAAASALAVGEVGPWTATSTLNTASTTAGAVAYNGFLYNVGGRDNAINAMNQIQYAQSTPMARLALG